MAVKRQNLVGLLKKRTKHKWTPEDDSYLRVNFDGSHASISKLAAFLGVGFYAVDTRLSRMGLKNKGRWQPWSVEDRERLTELVGQYPPQTVAETMGRSLYAVRGAVGRFGLRWGFRDGWYTAGEVAQILGVFIEWVHRRIAEGTLIAEEQGVVTHRAGPWRWRIQEMHLRQFILDHAGELVGRNVDLWAVVNIVAQGNAL